MKATFIVEKVSWKLEERTTYLMYVIFQCLPRGTGRTFRQCEGLFDQSNGNVHQMDNVTGNGTDHQVCDRPHAPGAHDDPIAL